MRAPGGCLVRLALLWFLGSEAALDEVVRRVLHLELEGRAEAAEAAAAHDRDRVAYGVRRDEKA